MNDKQPNDVKVNQSLTKLYNLRQVPLSCPQKNRATSINAVKCIENTLQLFEISNDRTNLMMDTYDDSDALISILNEKSGDVNFLIQICRSLSEKNASLQSRVDELTAQAEDDQMRKTHSEQQISLLKEIIEENDSEMCERILSQGPTNEKLLHENNRLKNQIEDLWGLVNEQASKLESLDCWQREQTLYYEEMKRQIQQLEEENRNLSLQLDYKESDICYRVEEWREHSCCDHEQSMARYEKNEEVMMKTISDLNEVVEDYRSQLSAAYNRLASMPPLDDGESMSLQAEIEELESKAQLSSAKPNFRNRILRQLETARIIQKARKCLEASKWSVYTPHNCPNEIPSIVTFSGGENMLLGTTPSNQGIRHRHTTDKGADSALDAWGSKPISGGSSKGSSSEGRQTLTIVKPIGGSNTMASWKKLATPGMESLLSTPSQGVVGRLMSGTNPNK